MVTRTVCVIAPDERKSFKVRKSQSLFKNQGVSISCITGAFLFSLVFYSLHVKTTNVKVMK